MGEAHSFPSQNNVPAFFVEIGAGRQALAGIRGERGFIWF